MKGKFLLLSTIITGIMLSTPSVSAEQKRSLQHNPELPNLNISEPKALTSKVDLPDLPDFTGQVKLERGLSYPANDQVEQTYAFIYQAKDDPARIIDWYRTALNMYKWDLDGSTSKAILGTNPRTGNSCSIYCDNEGAAGCKLHVSYTFMRKSTERLGSTNY
jgi:hypothetical protein